MTYRVIKTIKGRRYIYEQRTWREGARVRTQGRYIGPVDSAPTRRRLSRKIADFIAANMTPDDFVDPEQMLKDYNARVEREEAALLAKLDELYANYALRVSDDKPELRVNAPSVAQVPVVDPISGPGSIGPAEECPSIDEGQGSENGAASDPQNS